jgi:hypothetical protein
MVGGGGGGCIKDRLITSGVLFLVLIDTRLETLFPHVYLGAHHVVLDASFLQSVSSSCV